MHRILPLAVLAVWLLPAGSLVAQQPVVVQLPSYSVFSVNTTVVVPAGGYTHLGSVSRSAWGASSFGFHPLRNRAFGNSTTYRGVGARVWVHDLRAMDRRLLQQAEASRARGPETETAGRRPVFRGRASSRPAPAESFSRRFARTMREDRRVGGSLARLRARRMAETRRETR